MATRETVAVERPASVMQAMAMIGSHPTPEPGEDVETLNQRGNALREQQRLEDALKCYDGALAVTPGYPKALFNRGIVRLELGRAREALADLDRLLELDPGDAEAHAMRGNALVALNLPLDALESYDRALALDPGSVAALFGSGHVLQQLDRPGEALARYDRVLATMPNHAATLLHRGGILLALRRLDEALASYDRALELEPDLPGAWLNRGNVLLELSRPDDALASYDRALALDPGFADALNNRASVLQQTSRYDEAGRAFARLLELAPGYEYALGNLLDCRMRNCDWHDLAELTGRVAEGVDRGEPVVTPFVFLTASESAAAQLRCARSYADRRYPPNSRPLRMGQRHRHERIRVGYLSADFRDHAVAHLLADAFESHDRTRFETIAISYGPDDDSPMRERLQGSFEHFVDVRAQGDREVADSMRSRDVDIAVDLTGYTTYCRPGILAYRPAPVQVSFLGFPGTMGAQYLDYILADRIVVPEQDRPNYLEKVVYLPGTFFPPGAESPPNDYHLSRAAVGLPQQGFVFCSFNNTYKITPTLFAIWMRLLQGVDGSVLWLAGGSAAVQANLRREAAALGVSPERLFFAPWASYRDYRARFRLANLFLDTLPYNAHTTASDALRAGLPVLTCTGTTFAGRVAASLLDAVGVPELAVESLGDYEALAVKLATDAGSLDAISAKLRHNLTRCAVFDAARFCRHLESAYAAISDRSWRGEEPASFTVD